MPADGAELVVEASGIGEVWRCVVPTSAKEVDEPIPESSQVQFSLRGVELGSEFELRVGNGPTHRGRQFGNQYFWEKATWFESARGRTTIQVSEIISGEPSGAAATATLATVSFLVQPTKLGEERYRRLEAQVHGLSNELLFDLVGKSQTGWEPRNLHASARASLAIELRVLQRLWPQLCQTLAEALSGPELVPRHRKIRRRIRSGSNLAAATLTRLSNRGIDPRRFGRSSAVVDVPGVEMSFDTQEHRTLNRFLVLLRSRALECARAAAVEAELLTQEEAFLGPRPDQRRELDKAEESAIALAIHISDFRHRSGLSSVPTGERWELTPVFRHVANYRRLWLLMKEFLTTSGATVLSGDDLTLKPTWRLYEQWVFLQVIAALGRLGFKLRHQNILSGRSSGVFRLDLHRDAGADLQGPDGTQLRVRYEPLLFPRQLALEREKRFFRGTRGDRAWSPDVVIEWSDSQHHRWAIVIDAKYTWSPRHRIRGLEKYFEIRSTRTERPAVKQVWLAHPGREVESGPSIFFQDEALEFTTSPTRPLAVDERPLGFARLSPTADEEQERTVLEFLRGALALAGVDVPIGERPTSYQARHEGQAERESTSLQDRESSMTSAEPERASRAPQSESPVDILGLPESVLAKLSQEQARVLVLLENSESARASELANRLGKSPGRLVGLMVALRRKLHAEGHVLFYDESLPSGETQYRYLQPSDRRR